MNILNILIVDDIIVNRFILKEMIRKLGHLSMEAENGKQALELIQANDFDCVFMDIEMPVMNGFETIKAIRDTLPTSKKTVKVIALTAYNPKLLFEDFKETGFDMVFTKPFSIEKLTMILSENIQ